MNRGNDRLPTALLNSQLVLSAFALFCSVALAFFALFVPGNTQMAEAWRGFWLVSPMLIIACLVQGGRHADRLRRWAAHGWLALPSGLGLWFVSMFVRALTR